MDDNFFNVVKNNTANVVEKVDAPIKEYDTNILEVDNIYKITRTKGYKNRLKMAGLQFIWTRELYCYRTGFCRSILE